MPGAWVELRSIRVIAFTAEDRIRQSNIVWSDVETTNGGVVDRRRNGSELYDKKGEIAAR